MIDFKYLVGTSGTLRFTPRGREVLEPRLKAIGINIKNIKTVDQYLAALDSLSWKEAVILDERMALWPDTPEYNQLKSIMLDQPNNPNKKR
ncbi:MAG: hypothetical protein K6L73_13160 [Cellvibrionaceae bacterium]